MRFFWLVTIGIYLGLSGDTLAKTSRVIKGDCEDIYCEELWHKLRTNYPEKVAKYSSECPVENTLSLLVYAIHKQDKRVYLTCWEPKIENGERNGQSLGMLPFPGYEEQFGVKIASNDPMIQKRLDQNAEQVEKISFECATRGGDINILVLENQKVSVQCYFTVGAALIDLDGDWVSDGENSRGTMVDFSEELKN